MGLNLWAAIVIMVPVGMIIIHMLGCMALAGISANAVSLVNLVMVRACILHMCAFNREMVLVLKLDLPTRVTTN